MARGEDICAQCCATEREVTIDCPYSCGYLRESRLHEQRTLPKGGMPHRDVKIDDEFLGKSAMVLMLMAAFFNRALQPAPEAADHDAREALEALVTSFREGKEVVPEGEIAAGVVERFRQKMGEFTKELQERDANPFADRVLLGVLVFLARSAYRHDNGKPHSRAYVHHLRSTFPEGAA